MANGFQLWSGAFHAGEMIPKVHSCDGANLSPPLSWSAPPESTSSLVLIVDDPDAPRGIFVHWVLYNLAPEFNGRILRTGEDFNDGSDVKEGVNDFGDSGYGGPCPPSGSEHRYFFRLYALDAALDLDEGATKEQLTQAMDGHVLGEANLMGRYRR